VSAKTAIGGLVLDATKLWQQETGKTEFHAVVTHSCYRFFDGEMHYKQDALNVLVRALQQSTIRDRERFFRETSACRRRMEQQWKNTPLAHVFMMLDEWHALKQRSQAVFIREALAAKNLTLWEAFTAFDADDNGMLSPAEIYGALRWLDMPNLSAEDVVDLVESADQNRDGMIDYREYSTPDFDLF
jgi:hypothetical protein